MADQQGRVAVVTGGGRGLGQGVALGLAAAGATVVAVARNADQLGETEATGGRDALARSRAWPATSRTSPRCPAWATRSGSASARPPSWSTRPVSSVPSRSSATSTQRTGCARIQIDAIAPFLTVRAFLAGMLDAGWGRIVNVTSAASLHPPGPLNSAYGTAKVALNQFTRHLAAEIAGSGVTANVIHPGDVRTDMWADIRRQGRGPRDPSPMATSRGWTGWTRPAATHPARRSTWCSVSTTDAAADINGRFCWIDDPLQAPIPSWDEPVDERPWAT